MKKSEFDEIANFFDLRDFCEANGLSACKDIMDIEEMDNDINHSIYYAEERADNDWENLKTMLEEIPTGYDWYCKHGYLEYEYMTRYDFESVKRFAEEEFLSEHNWDPEEGDIGIDAETDSAESGDIMELLFA